MSGRRAVAHASTHAVLFAALAAALAIAPSGAPPQAVAQAVPAVSGTVALGSAEDPAGAGDVVVTARQLLSWGGQVDTTTTTDAAGAYAFADLPSGTYELRFDDTRPDGFATQWWPGEPVPSPAITRFTVGSTPLVRDIVMPPGAIVGGTVRAGDGTPLAGAAVIASASVTGGAGRTAEVAETTTVDDGSYRFDRLPPAGYVLRFVAPDTIEARAEFALDAGQSLAGVDATLVRRASLSGLVRCDGCDDPAVAVGLEVRLDRDTGAAGQPEWTEARVAAVTTTDEPDTGSYLVGDLEPGTYRARVVGTGAGPSPAANASLAVVVGEGDEATLDLAIRFGGFDRDVSGDGAPDVLVRTGSGVLRMYPGDGAGGWGAVSDIGSGWSVMDRVFMAGDFSGDGRLDLMARDTAGRLHLYRGDGAGGWLGWGVVGTGWSRMTSVFSPGDFDGDGRVDVLARDGSGDLWLYPGDGAGGFGETARVGTDWDMFDIVFPVGDFAGEAGVDVMGRTPAGELWLYPANGDGSWAIPKRVGTGWGVFDAVVPAGDFDGDGFDDVMGRDRSGRLWIYPGDGNGGWRSQSLIGTGWSGLSYVE